MTDNNGTVEVQISGWASVPLSASTEVEPIYDTNGDLDHTATMRRIEGRNLLSKAIDSMDTDELIAHLNADIEVSVTEVRE